jgi:hypothetical protein
MKLVIMTAAICLLAACSGMNPGSSGSSVNPEASAGGPFYQHDYYNQPTDQTFRLYRN